MVETSKKRKRSIESTNHTISSRHTIDANWQKLMASNLLMEKKTVKNDSEDNTQRYTGKFRRTRKKEDKEIEVIVPVKKDTNNEEKNKLTKFIAMDCEMVGVGSDGEDHMLARVSLVNKFGDCIFDKYVKAREEVIDYRTKVSGIRKEDLLKGEDFTIVQKEVAEILKGRVLVGHSLKNDLSVLFLSHPKKNIRDTSRYKPFRKITKGCTPSLKRLAKEILGIDIQSGEHSSIEDAKAAMQLYCTVAKEWEKVMSAKRNYIRMVEE